MTQYRVMARHRGDPRRVHRITLANWSKVLRSNIVKGGFDIESVHRVTYSLAGAGRVLLEGNDKRVEGLYL